MEDIRIGRDSQSAPFPVVFAAGGTQTILGKNAKRIRFVIGTTGGDTVFVGIGDATAGNNNGFAVSPANSPVVFRIEDYGPAIQGAITLSMTVAGIVSVMEVSLQKQ